MSCSRALDLHVCVNKLPVSSGGGQVEVRELGVGCEHCSVDVVVRNCEVKELES